MITLPLFLGLSSFGLYLDGGEPEWGRFRGPDGAGVAGDAGSLPTRFDAETNVAWKVGLPEGHSSPTIAGDRIFLTAFDGEALLTICVRRKTGETLWTQALEPRGRERLHEQNSAASPTATTDGERVAVYFGSFGLACYSVDGEELWVRPLDTPENTFGTAASPIFADGKLLFVSDSNKGSWLEAIDPDSGDAIWKRDRTDFKSGWSTPSVRNRNGISELLVYGVGWLTAYELADGNELWSVPGLTDEPIITPVVGQDLVFVSSYNMKTNTEVIGLPGFEELLVKHDHDGNGTLSSTEANENDSILSRFDADGEGDHPLRYFFRWLDGDGNGEINGKEYEKVVSWVDGFAHANGLLAIRPGSGEESRTEVVWQWPHGVPECPSPLYHDGRIYMIKNGGVFSCLDAASGKLLYSERTGARGPFYASPVAGDGKLYTASARGVVSVLALGDDYRLLARNDLGERIMATPALAGGHVYVRTQGHLYAFGGE